jgi:hypothetical protein
MMRPDATSWRSEPGAPVVEPSGAACQNSISASEMAAPLPS